ncbi:uncharacterized protein BHQ10_007441 [Talaromyces amestolkiae]|uniref:Uncharacterized protein n=1 Tax=Talaromyces amestolkiae TaxID=1196081 RepID=A0A364L6L9_TALAM|nr:uncharacterized protein BHQ10_007441 [Talaromyces amestolkiae]RAO71429.1 hypothetical protein BHQ10_007441 [Talaromyces amestolkiae]
MDANSNDTQVSNASQGEISGANAQLFDETMMAAVENIVEAAVEKAVNKTVKEFMGDVMMDTVDEIVNIAVQKAIEEISGRSGGLQPSSSSAQNNHRGRSIHIKRDPDADNSLADELNSPVVDEVRPGCKFRIYGESGGWHILGVNEMSNLTLESIYMASMPSVFYEWQYDLKDDYACFYNNAMEVYLQAADCGSEEGLMTVGSGDHHNQFYTTQDIGTGKRTLKCMYPGVDGVTEHLDAVEIRDDGEGRLVPVHYRKPVAKLMWKFKQVKKE